MIEIPLFKVHMPESIMEPLRETLFSGFIGQGLKVAEFEKKLQPFVDSEHVLTLNSCTSALHLALRLAGVGPGDEVISTPMTCTATNEPILERGATIVWADINPLTGCIDPVSIREKVSCKTKVIMCTHWAGYPCDLSEINQIAVSCGAKVIEDSAHAFGSYYQGKHIGCHSDFVCFSFQAIKHITTVDGGVLVCKNQEDYKRGKLLRWYGIDRDSPRTMFRCEDDIPEHGYKFHMNDVNATIGIAQLEYVNEILFKHRANASFYDNAFVQLPISSPVHIPSYVNDRISSYWAYPLLVDRKPEFMQHMKKAGIMVSMIHKRNDVHSMMSPFKCSGLLGVDMFEHTHVSIPVGWWLTPEQLNYIVRKVKEFI